ncbi:SLAP domain-containing protein [Schleiferilactobacillus harbinensis]|uniref:SLAP domain-containing protein n=1 Tax=Schleiferilactobacillus harbinensis TaxID=304207 RepID=UPI001AAFEE8A|nr:SLAP domain-containing protein [Schleiferilactobacillus harbinensis]MBO3093069.1 SLAP domain-containing protein [Schleiferilactobacillus harbinensis]
MKKFSKVKYFGAVAAALLAVAPIAAPVVSQVASPAVVQAATTTDAQKVLNYYFKDSTTTSKENLKDFVSGEPAITAPQPLKTRRSGSNYFLGSLLTNGDLPSEFANYYVQVVFSGYEGYSASQVASDLDARGAGTYTATVYLFNANPSATNKEYDTPALASKTVTLTVPAATVPVSGVSSVSDATVANGSSVTPFKTFASIVGSTKFALSDGSTRDAVPSDFKEFVGFTKSSRAGIDPKVTEDDGSVTGSTFTTPGTYYVLFELSDTLSNSLTGAGTTQTVSLRKNNSGNWYVARKVVVGDYTESAATGTANVVNGQGTTVYSDPTTITSTGKTLDYGTAWKVYSVVKNSAGTVLAYNLGGKQYVKASDVSSTAVSNQAGVFTVKYPSNPTWSIAVYNSDLKVQKLIPAGSTWMTFGVKTLKDGKSYYNVGGDQWVRTDYGYWNAK